MPAGRPRKVDSPPQGHRTSTELAKRSNQQFVSPAAPRQIPVCPDDLGERGQVEWDKIWSAGYWLKPEQDYHMVLIVARAYDEMISYQDQIALDGLMVRGSAGGVVAHGLIREVRQTRQQIIRILAELGFSPTARARLNIAELQQGNALLALQERARRNAQR
jgi:P27 family predicted phage terminase small subunit